MMMRMTRLESPHFRRSTTLQLLNRQWATRHHRPAAFPPPQHQTEAISISFTQKQTGHHPHLTPPPSARAPGRREGGREGGDWGRGHSGTREAGLGQRSDDREWKESGKVGKYLDGRSGMSKYAGCSWWGKCVRMAPRSDSECS